MKMPTVRSYFSRLSAKSQINLAIKFFSIYKIPLLAFCWPQITLISEEQTELTIPLNRRTQNHLGGMYFGALSIGAELVIALALLDEIRKNGSIEFIFKDFEAHFLKRTNSNAKFICKDGLEIRKLVEKARISKQRENQTFECFAYTDDQNNPVAKFKLTLSIKSKSIKAS